MKKATPRPSKDTPTAVDATTAYATFTEDSDWVAPVQQAKFDYTKRKIELQLDRDRWQNRRRMAWIALGSTILAVVAMFTVVPESKIADLDEVVSWFMMGMFSIVGTYIGTATWAEVCASRNNKPAGGANTPWDNYGGGRLDDPASTKENYYSEQ